MNGGRARIRELAQRTSAGVQITLLWREGTRDVWVEAKGAILGRMLVAAVEPDRALEAFHHPFAYLARALAVQEWASSPNLRSGRGRDAERHGKDEAPRRRR